MKIPLSLGPSYNKRTLNDVQRCINLYPEKTDEGYVLISTHGMYLLVTTANDQPCRGRWVASNGRVFSAHGDTLYELSNVGVTPTMTSRGTLSTSSGFVDMADDGTRLILVDGTAGYTLTFSGNAFATISDANYPDAAYTVTVQDQRAIVALNNLFYLSELADATDWTPVRSATAEYSGDIIRCVRSVGGKLYLIGAKTIEPWYNTGNASFTYERVTGGPIDIGCIDAKTVAVLNGAIYFLSSVSGGSVWRIGAEGVQRISTPYIESLIADCTIGDGTPFGFCFQKSGHDVYQLTPSTSSNITLVYDITENCWYQKSSGQTYHRARFIFNAFDDVATFADTPIALDALNGKVYSCLDNINTENGTAIIRTRDFGPIEAGANRIYQDRLRIELEVAHDTEASYTFTSTLSKSDNGGRSFDAGVTMSRAVTNGTSAQRVPIEARRLGSSRERYYRWTNSDSVRLVMKLAELEAEMGAH